MDGALSETERSRIGKDSRVPLRRLRWDPASPQAVSRNRKKYTTNTTCSHCVFLRRYNVFLLFSFHLTYSFFFFFLLFPKKTKHHFRKIWIDFAFSAWEIVPRIERNYKTYYPKSIVVNRFPVLPWARNSSLENRLYNLFFFFFLFRINVFQESIDVERLSRNDHASLNIQSIKSF